jgi:hypothetical protein
MKHPKFLCLGSLLSGDKMPPTHIVLKFIIEPPTSVLQRFFKGNQWLLAFSEVNEKMTATWAAPALKKRKERKKKEELEERISKLEEEVKKHKEQLERQD